MSTERGPVATADGADGRPATAGLPVVTGRGRDSIWLVIGPVALAAAIAVVNAVVARGYVLDDWFLVRAVSQDGIWSVVEPDLLAARPGSLVAYLLPFGLAPGNPTATAIVQGAYVVVAALLAVLVARKLTTPVAAAAIVTVWVVLPNHQSLEIWPSAIVATASVALLLGGVLLLLRERLSPAALLVACVLMAWACLTYEASLVPAALAFVWAPRRMAGRPSLDPDPGGCGHALGRRRVATRPLALRQARATGPLGLRPGRSRALRLGGGA